MKTKINLFAVILISLFFSTIAIGQMSGQAMEVSSCWGIPSPCGPGALYIGFTSDARPTIGFWWVEGDKARLAAKVPIVNGRLQTNVKFKLDGLVELVAYADNLTLNIFQQVDFHGKIKRCPGWECPDYAAVPLPSTGIYWSGLRAITSDKLVNFGSRLKTKAESDSIEALKSLEKMNRELRQGPPKTGGK